MALKFKKKDLTIAEELEVIKTWKELGDDSEQQCTILLSVSLFMKKYVVSKNSIIIYNKQLPLDSTIFLETEWLFMMLCIYGKCSRNCIIIIANLQPAPLAQVTLTKLFLN